MPWTKILAEAAAPSPEQTPEGRCLTYGEALREAQSLALANDPAVIIMGEGVDDPGGIFGSTKDLHTEYGTDRVFDLPIAENGCTGFAIGAAITGMRPIFVHMRVDFMLMAMDQLANHAAKWRYMFGGRQNVPLVIRAIIGRGWGSAAQHSQSLHGMFLQIPGLKVIMPFTPYDAKGLLLSAVADNDPVLCIEHRWLYDHNGPVPESLYTVPIGKASVLRRGKDITIAAISLMVHEALAAAQELARIGIEAEVIDLRTVTPLDSATVIKSVQKTGRLLVADASSVNGGLGAELAARVQEEIFSSLKCAVRRVGLPHVPTPASETLEQAYYQDKTDITNTVQSILAEEKR